MIEDEVYYMQIRKDLGDKALNDLESLPAEVKSPWLDVIILLLRGCKRKSKEMALETVQKKGENT